MARFCTSAIGYDLIKAFEGFRALSAPLTGDGWVIGYGHTVSARAGVRVSRADAADLLKWDVAHLEGPLVDLVFAPLCQNQFDALISLVFNIGLENFRQSTVLRRLNEGCPVDAAAGFDAWRCARMGKDVIVVDALVRRRAAEKALFLSAPGTNVIAPTPQLPPLCDVHLVAEHGQEQPLDVQVDMGGAGIVRVLEPARATELDFVAGDNEGPAEASGPQDGAAAPDFVPLDEAFERDRGASEPEPDMEMAATPISVIAERIVGDLDQIATAPIQSEGGLDDGASSDAEEKNLKAEASDENDGAPTPAGENQTGDGLADDDEPPLVDEVDDFPEATKLEENQMQNPGDWDDGETSSSANYDTDLPDLKTDAPVVPEERPFQPVPDRGRTVFVLMGILGIALGFGALWQIQRNGTNITTPYEMATGPAPLGLGVLMVVVAAYFLIRRLGKSGEQD